VSTAPAEPFSPPPDYQFEPEFHAESPRPIPPELYKGRYASGQYNQIVGVAVAGVVCLACSFLPFVQTWGLYFLPLAYLDWIGAGLLVFALGGFVVAKVRRGPFRYVVAGVPVVARVLELELRPTMYHNGGAVSFRYFAVLGLQDADTGELKALETSSNEIAAGFKDGLDCTYRVGDYATAVYLPGKLERSLRLYGFLDLRPGLGVVKKDRSAEKPTSPIMGALGVLAIFGFFFALCWDLYAMGRYRPLDWMPTMLIPGVGGAVVLGGLLIGFLWVEQRRSRRQLAERNAVAAAEGRALEPEPPSGGFGAIFLGLIVVCGSLGMGGLTCCCWAWTLNAWLDASEPKPRPVRIEKMVQVTHNGIFRQYQIEYRFADELVGEKQEYLSTPDEMRQFAGTDGDAQIKAGFFGWRWVERIKPAGFVRQGGP
jgi:hypothetical protein